MVNQSLFLKYAKLSAVPDIHILIGFPHRNFLSANKQQRQSSATKFCRSASSLPRQLSPVRVRVGVGLGLGLGLGGILSNRRPIFMECHGILAINTILLTSRKSTVLFYHFKMTITLIFIFKTENFRLD